MTDKERLEHLAGRLEDTIEEICNFIGSDEAGQASIEKVWLGLKDLQNWVETGKAPYDGRQKALFLPMSDTKKNPAS